MILKFAQKNFVLRFLYSRPWGKEFISCGFYFALVLHLWFVKETNKKVPICHKVPKPHRSTSIQFTDIPSYIYTHTGVCVHLVLFMLVATGSTYTKVIELIY